MKGLLPLEPNGRRTEQPLSSPYGWTFLLQLVPFVVSAVLLVLLLVQTNAGILFARLNYLLLVPAALTSLVLNGIVGSFKFHIILGLCGIKAGWLSVLRFWASLWVTIVLPFQTGHLVYVAALRSEADTSWSQALEAVAYDRYVTMVGTMALVLCGQLLLPNEHVLDQWWLLWIAAGGVLFYFLDPLIFTAMGRVTFLRNRFKLLTARPPFRTKVQLVLLGVIYQLSEVIAFYLACRALGVNISLPVAFGAYPVILLLSMIPVTVSGIGARAALIVLFLGHSLSYSQGVAAGILVDFIEHILPALTGAFFLRYLIAVLAGHRQGLVKQEVGK
jgi:glycosyltransferase 2 family protein